MKVGKVIGVCTSSSRGTGKTNINEGYLEKDKGLRGDAHLGAVRQVSILLAEYADEVAKKHNFTANPGDWAENITVRGLDLADIKIGTLLQVGESILEVIEIGKHLEEPHTFSFHGMAILVDIGVFCKVNKSGNVKVGDEVKILN
jgi:MOSC domain-containing protein YiiM